MLKISTIAGASVAAVAVGVGLVSGATAATAQPGGNHQNQNQNRQGDRVTDQRTADGYRVNARQGPHHRSVDATADIGQRRLL